MVMIDWVTASIPFEWDEPINDGRVEKIASDRSLVSTKDRWLSVVGSGDSNVQVLSGMDQIGLRKVLHVSGNPSKFLQGHNLFGSGDLVGLNGAFFCEIAKCLNHKISNKEYYCWTNGQYSVSRVDINAMFSCGTRAGVRELCQNIEVLPHLALRRIGGDKDGCSTVYIEPARVRKKINARRQAPRWGARIYGKADELGIRYIPCNLEEWERLKDRSWGGRLPENIPLRDLLCFWVDEKARVERQLNRKFLHEHNLSRAANWRVPDQLPEYLAQELITELLKQLRYYDGAILDANLKERLPKNLRIPFELWRHGEDLRSAYPSTTLKRYRSQILETLEIDILGKSKARNDGAISASKPWDLIPAPIPGFAEGTSLVAQPHYYSVNPDEIDIDRDAQLSFFSSSYSEND